MNHTIKTNMVKYKKIKHSKVTIGILLPPYISTTNTNIKAYLDPTYVKWLSKANAAVLPIMYNLPKHKLYNYLSQINGILLPGGGIDNKQTHSRAQFLKYQHALYLVIKYVKKQNDKKNYYPIWATCMSFQLLAILETHGKLKSRNLSLLDNVPYYGLDRLYMTNKLHSSKLKRLFTKKQIRTFKKRPSIYHYHERSFLLNNKIMKQLKNKISILAVNKDVKNKEYVSIYEFKKYPFYAVLFHPEYPLIDKKRIDRPVRNKQTRLISDKLGEFFIKECTKNKNVIKNVGKKSINHYPVYEFTKKNKFKRMYYFKN